MREIYWSNKSRIDINFQKNEFKKVSKKKPLTCLKCKWYVLSDLSGIRTRDPLLKRQMLYLLS